MPAIGWRAAALETFTMRPQFSEAICGSASLAQRNAPVTFTSKTWRHESGSMAATGSGTPGVPALLTRIVTAPSSEPTLSKPEATEASSVTSMTRGRAVPPRFEISAATEATSFSVRAARATAAPCRARSFAVAAPMPRPPPVTRATRPACTLSSMPPMIPGAEGCEIKSRTNSLKEHARVRHTPIPAERGADAGGAVAAAHLRGALQADGQRVPRRGERVRDGAGRRVGHAEGGLHGEDSGARRALRGRADADPGRGLAALQAQQHPHRQALLRRGGRVPRGGDGGGCDGTRGGVHRPARAGSGGGDGGLGGHRDKASVQKPLVRHRRPHRVRPRGEAADPGAHLGEGTPEQGQGAPLRGGREARARATGPREGPEERPSARRLAARGGVGCYNSIPMLRTVVITGAISFAI